jgi:hypothetical protein
VEAVLFGACLEEKPLWLEIGEFEAADEVGDEIGYSIRLVIRVELYVAAGILFTLASSSALDHMPSTSPFCFGWV